MERNAILDQGAGIPTILKVFLTLFVLHHVHFKLDGSASKEVPVSPIAVEMEFAQASRSATTT